MSSLRVLHVDDEPDIREVVELSLGLDPELAVRSCASGRDALVAAADWPPDVILLDVMMPVMDGPATLARLRESPQTANIPVVFMTARAQARELEHFRSLGAAGVIAKPFDPMALAGAVRSHLRSAAVSGSRETFLRRLKADAAALATSRPAFAQGANASAALERVGSMAHGLSGAAGIFGFSRVSREAATLEAAVVSALKGDCESEDVEHALERLLAAIVSVNAEPVDTP
jgi:CheY-like chemotaxis protein